jgi:hypothetical protein
MKLYFQRFEKRPDGEMDVIFCSKRAGAKLIRYKAQAQSHLALCKSCLQQAEENNCFLELEEEGHTFAIVCKHQPKIGRVLTSRERDNALLLVASFDVRALLTFIANERSSVTWLFHALSLGLSFFHGLTADGAR